MNVVEDKTLGYMYFMDKSHPLANRQGKVYFHRHVAMIKIGRVILSHEDVHHVDGNKKNNDPDNLVVITRSEHARIHNPPPPMRSCRECGIETSNSDYCSYRCSRVGARIASRPSKTELEDLVWQMPSSEISKRLGLKSDSNINKWCKSYGISKPPRGYWAKVKAGLN